MTVPMRHTDQSAELNDVTRKVVDAMIAVHSELGPGLLESLYKEALAYELQQRALLVRREVPIPIRYKGAVLGGGLRLDLLVDDKVIVEAKTVRELDAVHFAQIDSYLHLTGVPVGFLVNFNVEKLKGSFHRRVRRTRASP
jgi:GxxExxY protein